MPWIRKGKTEKYVRPPRPDTSLLDTPFTTLLDDPVRLAERTRQVNALRRYVNLLIMDWIEFHKICPRKACRRAGACRSPTVECHEENFETLKEHFYPDLLKLIRERRGEPQQLYDPGR